MIYLSVVIPYFNNGTTIGALLQSLVRCQRPELVEVVVVDDGSTEETDASTQRIIVDSRRLLDLRWIRQEHRGASAARNEGLRNARGRYVWFVDADDRVDEVCLDYLTSWIEDLNDNTPLLKMGALWLRSHDRLCTPVSKASCKVPIHRILSTRAGALDHTTYLFNCEFLRTNNIAYPEGHRVLEDSTLVLRCIDRADNIAWNPTYRFYHYYEPFTSRGPWSDKQQAEFLPDIEFFFHSFLDTVESASGKKQETLKALYDYYLYLHIRILTVKGYHWRQLQDFKRKVSVPKTFYFGRTTIPMAMMRHTITHHLFYYLCYIILHTRLRYVLRRRK